MPELVQVQRVAAYGLIRDERGRVLLVRSSPTADVPDTWFLPGGGVEHGEHPREALVREVAEETGLRCRVGELVDVHSSLTELRRRGELVHTVGLVYRAETADRALRREVGGSSELPEWIEIDRALTLPLAPFVGEVVARDDATPRAYMP